MAWNSSFRARNHSSIKFITSRGKEKAFCTVFRLILSIPQIPSTDSQRDRCAIVAPGSLSPLLCYCVMLFLKPPPCFFALPCLSKDFTQEFSDASWTYGYFLTSGLSNEILSLSCRPGLLPVGLTILGCQLQFLSRGLLFWWCQLATLWKAAFSKQIGDLWVWETQCLPGLLIRWILGHLFWLLLYCNVKLYRTEGFFWLLFAFSGRWEEYIVSLLPCLTWTISMKWLRWIESIHSNQRERSDGVKSRSASFPCMSEEFLE